MRAFAQGLSVHTVPVSAKTTWLFLELRFDGGLRGWGEVTDFGNEAAIAAEADALDAALRNQRLSSLAGALHLMEARQDSRSRRVMRSGLEQAWRDAQARANGVPLVEQIGDAYRHSVRVYANINRGIPVSRTPEDFAARAREAVSHGYRAVKIAPFDDFHWQRTADETGRQLRDRGIARIHAVREAVGPDTGVLVDCHGRFDAVSARAALDAAAPANPFWFEDVLDPVFAADQAREIRRHAHHHSIRIAGGEEIGDLSAFLSFLEDGATDVVLPDLRQMGLRTGMVICEVATAKGQYVSLHNPVGPVLDAVSLHVAAALSEFLILERPFRESPLWSHLRANDAALEDSRIRVETTAGLGFEPDRVVPSTAATTGSSKDILSFRGVPEVGTHA